MAAYARITRRAALSTLAGSAAALTVAPAPAAEVSPLVEMIAHFRFADAQIRDALRHQDALEAATPEFPGPEVRFAFGGAMFGDRMRFQCGIASEFSNLYGRMRDIYGDAAGDAIAAIEKLEALSLEDLGKQEETYSQHRRAAGLTDAENAVDAAELAFDGAFDAIVAYRPRDLDEVALRSGFLAQFAARYPKDFRVQGQGAVAALMGFPQGA